MKAPKPLEYTRFDINPTSQRIIVLKGAAAMIQSLLEFAGGALYGVLVAG